MPNTPVQGLPYPALSDPANGPVALQNLALGLEDYKTIIRCTSTTRPAHVEGRQIYETDTDKVMVSDGTNWVAFDTKWTSFNPTVTGANLGTGTKGGRWKANGRTLYLNLWCTFGSGWSINGNSASIGFTLPINPAGDPTYGNAFSMTHVIWNIPGVNAFYGFGYLGSNQIAVGTITDLNGYLNTVTPTRPPINASTVLNVNAIYQIA